MNTSPDCFMSLEGLPNTDAFGPRHAGKLAAIHEQHNALQGGKACKSKVAGGNLWLIKMYPIGGWRSAWCAALECPHASLSVLQSCASRSFDALLWRLSKHASTTNDLRIGRPPESHKVSHLAQTIAAIFYTMQATCGFSSRMVTSCKGSACG